MRPMASTRERVAEALQTHGVTDESAVAAIVEALPPDADAAYRADYVSLPVLATLMAEMSNRLDATINAKIAESSQQHQAETAAEFKAVRESIQALDLKLTADMKGLEQRVDASLQDHLKRITADMRALEQRVDASLQDHLERITADMRALEQRVEAALREQSERISETLRVQSERNAEALRVQSEQNAEALRQQNVRNAQELRDFMEQALDRQRAMQWRLIGAIIGGAGVIATVVGVVLGTT